ncbi:hypothetical protein BDV93DRAFT_556027 [Ceratobasidium sp. AG-I]|nr:hypothetical protein BDV93DRAFT_556027 [Ceratobasidium sp. AG-I]
MHLRDSELSELAVHSFVHDSAILASASVDAVSGDSQSRTLVMRCCKIHTSPETLHNAFSSLPWHALTLDGCRHSPTAQGADGPAEALVPINLTSEFGIRLGELLSDRQVIQTYGFVSVALQQWVDARMHLSKAIQAYISATTFLESTCTPFSIKPTPGILDVIENNLEIMEHTEFDLHKAQAALKKKRNSYISPIYTLPSELLAYVFTTTVAPTQNHASDEYAKRNLSRVCSHWRQVVQDICPFWAQSSLGSVFFDF